jgi:hypothetical protein
MGGGRKKIRCCSQQSLQGQWRLQEAPAWKSHRVSQPGGQDTICHQMSQTQHMHSYWILDDKSASTQQGWLEQTGTPNEIPQWHMYTAPDP